MRSTGHNGGIFNFLLAHWILRNTEILFWACDILNPSSLKYILYFSFIDEAIPKYPVQNLQLIPRLHISVITLKFHYRKNALISFFRLSLESKSYNSLRFRAVANELERASSTFLFGLYLLRKICFFKNISGVLHIVCMLF